LFPDPRVISVQFDDISSVGMSVNILSELTPEQDGELFTFIAASKRGNYVPVQLLFNNVKIPVNVVNHSRGNKYGLCLSKHQKLLELAEKGRQFLKMLVDAAVKKGASEADFVEHKQVVALDSPPAAGAVPAKPESKAVLPEEFKNLPPKHPMAEVIKMRFDAFNRKVFFFRSLGQHVAPYYFNHYVKRDSEIVKVFGDDLPLQKKTVYRWVPNELNLKIDGGKGVTGIIECSFKQAMYSYMRQKKRSDISFDDIMGLFEGKLPDQYRLIRDVFLASVCQIVEVEVQKRFYEYHADTNEDYLKAQELKEEEQLIASMSPEELMKSFLWPKVVALGELAQYQKETAKSWVPKDKSLKISELGCVVVLSKSAFDTFLGISRGSTAGGEDPRDFFDEIDLERLYAKTVDSRNGRIRGTFGVYVDSIPSDVKKDALLGKVINSQDWAKYYILKKSRAYFARVFGVRDPAMCNFIENNMLTSSAVGEYV